MRDREAAGVEFGKQRLHVAQDRFAGGRIAHVAHGLAAGQALDYFALGEGIADQAEPAFGVKAFAVVGDDAGRFLAAMLERVKAERGEGRRVVMADDAEYAAFLAQAIAHRVGIEIQGRFVCHAHQAPYV